MNYRPKEKTHPEILKNLKEAESRKQPELLAQALLEEVSYIDRYSKDKSVADSTTEQLLGILDKNKNLANDLQLIGYSTCSSHYLSRMAECLSKSKKDSDGTAKSADFLNKADQAATKAAAVLKSTDKDLDMETIARLLKLAKEYSRQHDFKRIVSEETLRELCRTTEKLTDENADKSFYRAANMLNELSSIYELSLKDFAAAAATEKTALKYYLKSLPEESLEVTDLRLSLSRNMRKADKLSEAIAQLKERLVVLEAINSISEKAEESTLYDYVVTLKELGGLYKAGRDYKEALATATKIVDSYKKLDALEDLTFANALYLKGKSSLEIGRAKKSIAYLADAFELIRTVDKSRCLIDLATAYSEVGKSKEAKLFALIVKDYLSNQLSRASTTDDALSIGDQAVRVAQVLDQLNEPEHAVSLLELGLSAYTSDYVFNLTSVAAESGKQKDSKKLANHLVTQMKKFEPILRRAERPERALAIKKVAEAIEAKVSSGDDFDSSWLAKLAW